MTFWKSQPAWLRNATLVYVALWVGALLAKAMELLPQVAVAAILALAIPLAIVWLRRVADRWSEIDAWVVASCAYPPLWRAIVESLAVLGLHDWAVGMHSTGGLGLFLLGLGWTVWGLEKSSRRIEMGRIAAAQSRGVLLTTRSPNVSAPASTDRAIWSPLDPAAWYYGRDGQKLKQSTLALAAYSLAFWMASLLLSQIGGCAVDFDLPAGGGKQMAVVQTVKIEKVIRKKFILNPFSAILFQAPPIDDVKLQLQEVTAHQYQIGQGEGEGAGYSSGKGKGKVSLIRLEYDGGDWNLNHGLGGDLNMLIQYGVMTGQAVDDRPQSVRPLQILRRWTPEKSPPLLFVTGQGSFSLAANETKAMREYLIDRHGMLFASSGSQQFHYQFVAAIQRALPEIRPVSVPLDDPIHRIPFSCPSLPYVVPHGGKEAIGWSMDGRWLVYLHPGDISDAWADGHAGVPADIYNGCYRLGANVIQYGFAQANSWRESKRESK